MGAEDRILAGVLVKVVVGFLEVLDIRTDFPTGWGCLVVLITRLVIGGLEKLSLGNANLSIDSIDRVGCWIW